MPKDRKGKSKGGASSEVEISKSLSYLLRHGAKDVGIKLDEGGWASVADVLAWRRMASLHVDFPTLQSIVATNDKKRFQLEPNLTDPHRSPSISEPAKDWRIRATQGHSITTISSEHIFKPILSTDADCPNFVVHGTDKDSWKEIQRTGGLKTMRRKHIHFATRLPEKMPELDEKFQAKSKPKQEAVDKVISGMRNTSTIVIWVDVKASLEAGMKWWRSENEVILTEGMGEPGMVGFEWIKWVERRGSGEVLYGERVDSAEVWEMERRMDKLKIGLEDGGKETERKVVGERVVEEKGPQAKADGKAVDGEKTEDGNEKLEPAVAVKDHWDD